MSLLFNMLSRLVITFLPRSKRLIISWLQSPSAVILEHIKIKSDIVSTVSPSICHEVMGLYAMIFVLWMLSFKPTFSLVRSKLVHLKFKLKISLQILDFFLFKNTYFFETLISITSKYMMWKQIDIKGEWKDPVLVGDFNTYVFSSTHIHIQNIFFF